MRNRRRAHQGRRIEARAVVNAVLWLLSTGKSCNALPGRYPSSPTCRRRFDQWRADGTLAEVIKRLGESGRDISLDRAGAMTLKWPAQPQRPGQNRTRGAFRASPASWRAPVKTP
ncbi:transposase [Paraburkholderia tuberum]|uniref:Putative transposase n=1 Tax=Paraburkholderia tuberum TaxID=157910 RepID=A0A1H1KCS9_9BURK|nr:transposase [Paraburkholderia tuberum]SDR60094.1 putative transposase [Paraburkholderia tuberum]